MNVLVACGICTKCDPHSYQWQGFDVVKPQLISLFSTYFLKSQQQIYKSAFKLPSASSIGTVTQAFLAIFIYFMKQSLSIHDASIIMAADIQAARPLLRRLYLVSYLLERIGIISKVSTGEYLFSYDVNALVKEALNKMSKEESFNPESIEAQMHSFPDSYIQHLAQLRQSILIKILDDKPSSTDDDVHLPASQKLVENLFV